MKKLSELQRYFVVFFCSIFALILFNPAQAETNLNTNGIQNYLKSLPAPGPFTGLKETDLVQTPLLPFSPISKYDIELDSGNTDSIQKGNALELKGALTYMVQGTEAQKEKDQCKQNSQLTIELQNNDNTSSKKKDIALNNECDEATSFSVPKIENAGIYVQIFQRDEDKTGALKGDYLVDEFYIKKGVELIQNQKVDFSFNWKIPTQIKSGKYYVAFFVDSNGRSNLKGLPVVYGDYAKVFDFQIQKGNSENYLEIDKNNIQVNGKTYVSRIPSPTEEPVDNQVNIQIPIVNHTDSIQNAGIKYEITGWRQDDPQDLITSKEEQKSINAGETLNYSFNVDTSDTSQSLYHVKIMVSTKDGKSAYDIHFVIKDRSRAMFTFLGIANNSPFFCLKNKNWQGFFDGRVQLNLTNQNDKTVTWTKEGNIGTSVICFAVKNSTLNLNSGCAKLTGQISDKNSGKIVDKQEIDICSQDTAEKQGSSNSNLLKEEGQSKVSSQFKLLILALLGIILLITGIILSIKYLKNERN